MNTKTDVDRKPKGRNTARILMFLLGGMMTFQLLLSAGLFAQEQSSEKEQPLGNAIIKKGAVEGNRSWDNAWKLRTNHFIVRTNISKRAAFEIGRIMELLLQKFSQIRAVPISKRVKVLVFKNQSEYVSNGKFASKKNNGYFLYRSWGGNRIVTYYQPGSTHNTVRVLLHEGTHMFLKYVLRGSSVDLWLNEGIAVYFEASKLTKEDLEIGFIPRNRFLRIRKLIKVDKYTPLKKLFFISREKFNINHYAQSWSVVYFLLHANDHQYSDLFDRYTLSFGNEPGLSPVQRYRKYFQIPFEKLEKKWLKFMKNLNPNKTDTVKVGRSH